ncbi:hypothetical protein [Pseudoalteromonas sp. T1lg75]|uniref:hypothetical protein n=1 Tax=Pseudoalteromonas sp. T1lg75 TaxID=2077102 RepID=UPI000CF5EC7B|nr:hypothetical protein [Pseudoalteromonas sp. T1lg75]
MKTYIVALLAALLWQPAQASESAAPLSAQESELVENQLEKRTAKQLSAAQQQAVAVVDACLAPTTTRT